MSSARRHWVGGRSRWSRSAARLLTAAADTLAADTAPAGDMAAEMPGDMTADMTADMSAEAKVGMADMMGGGMEK